MLTLIYYVEYKNRFDFILAIQEATVQSGFRRLLKNFPNGVVILSNDNTPLFYNRSVGSIISKKTGKNSTRSPDFEDSNLLNTYKEGLFSAMQDIIEQGGKKNLKEVIENWTTGDLEEKGKYTYKQGENEFTYTIKGLRSYFQSRECRAIIIQDETASDKLGKLNERYQKLYVASIVHDIRTPLNGIVGMLEMLKDFNINEEGNLYISVARKTCTLLLFLTYDITDFSQLEANKFKANNGQVDIREVLSEVMALLSFNFERKKLDQLHEVCEGVPRFFYVDKNRYMQILLNLLGNALKFTFHGHVKVSIDYDPDNDVLITLVRDTGIGIKDNEMPKLFQLFGKLESSSSLNPQGVGFGLAVCKRLAESLGGYISVISKYGFGSTFTFGIKGNISSLKAEEEKKFLPASSFLNVSSLISPNEIAEKLKSHNSKEMHRKASGQDFPVLVNFFFIKTSRVKKDY